MFRLITDNYTRSYRKKRLSRVSSEVLTLSQKRYLKDLLTLKSGVQTRIIQCALNDSIVQIQFRKSQSKLITYDTITPKLPEYVATLSKAKSNHY